MCLPTSYLIIVYYSSLFPPCFFYFLLARVCPLMILSVTAYERTLRFCLKKNFILIHSSLLFSLHHVKNTISSSLAFLLGLSNQHSFVGNMSHLLIFFFFLVSWKIFHLSLISWNIISLYPCVRCIFIILHETYCSSSTWEITFNTTFSLWIVSLLSFLLFFLLELRCVLELFNLFSLIHTKKNFISILYLWQNWEKST